MLAKLSFEGLGTVWHLEADVTPATLKECSNIALQFQHDYSRFEGNSVLARLNTSKHLHKAPEELLSMLRYGIHASKQTGGLFNLTSGAILTARGYGQNNPGNFVEEWQDGVSIDGSSVTLAPDINLDFGGFGKGWLVDKLFTFLKNSSATEIFINGGGDIRLLSLKLQEVPLMVPDKPSEYFDKVSFKNGAVATSSSLMRVWGEENHIVDKSGHSYKGKLAQVSVFANTAVAADTAATACMIAADPFKLAHAMGVEILTVYKNGKFSASNGFPLKKSSN